MGRNDPERDVINKTTKVETDKHVENKAEYTDSSIERSPGSNTAIYTCS